MSITGMLKRLMDEQGISIFEISKRSKISFQTIQNILEGKTKSPQAKTIRRLADYFRVTIRQIKGLDKLNEVETPDRIELLESRLVQLENQVVRKEQDPYKKPDLFPELLIACPSVIDAETRERLESKYRINIRISRLDEKTKNTIFRYIWVVDRFRELRT
jgi:transcriptional regulator with XRE-family HTH domain